MPIEIRELVIKAVVDHAGEQNGDGDRETSTRNRAEGERLEEMVQRILEQVSDNRNER